jgi:hypothetical protein
LRVVADLGYCCETILKGRLKDVHITGRIRKDSALFAPVQTPAVRRRGRLRKKGCRLPTPAVMFQDPNLTWSEIKAFCYGKEIRFMVHQFTALWYHGAGIEQITILLCSDPNGRHPDIVFFDTDNYGVQIPWTLERLTSRFIAFRIWAKCGKPATKSKPEDISDEKICRSTAERE